MSFRIRFLGRALNAKQAKFRNKTVKLFGDSMGKIPDIMISLLDVD